MLDSVVGAHNASVVYPYNVVPATCDPAIEPLDAEVADGLLKPGGILYELLRNEKLTKEEDEEDDMRARTDIYYKGRNDQEKIDDAHYRRVAQERKDNLLSFLKEVRSESLSDDDATSRNRVEAIIRFVERQ